MEIDSKTAELIQQIYGNLPDVLIQGLEKLPTERISESNHQLWSERDIVLITLSLIHI